MTKSTKSVLNSYKKQYNKAMKKERKKVGLPVNRKPYYWEKYNKTFKLSKAKKSKPINTSYYVKANKSAKKIEEQENINNGCYIATCVYGSYDCPEVWTLRRFRDNTLDVIWFGRLFIQCYYTISPIVVKIFGKKHWFRVFWKKILDVLVFELNKYGVECTEYKDKY